MEGSENSKDIFFYFFIPSRRRFQKAVAKCTDNVTHMFYYYIILGSESL